MTIAAGEKASLATEINRRLAAVLVREATADEPGA
jgi:hypothetical protein